MNLTSDTHQSLFRALERHTQRSVAIHGGRGDPRNASQSLEAFAFNYRNLAVECIRDTRSQQFLRFDIGLEPAADKEFEPMAQLYGDYERNIRDSTINEELARKLYDFIVQSVEFAGHVPRYLGSKEERGISHHQAGAELLSKLLPKPDLYDPIFEADIALGCLKFLTPVADSWKVFDELSVLLKKASKEMLPRADLTQLCEMIAGLHYNIVECAGRFEFVDSYHQLLATTEIRNDQSRAVLWCLQTLELVVRREYFRMTHVEILAEIPELSTTLDSASQQPLPLAVADMYSQYNAFWHTRLSLIRDCGGVAIAYPEDYHSGMETSIPNASNKAMEELCRLGLVQRVQSSRLAMFLTQSKKPHVGYILTERGRVRLKALDQAERALMREQVFERPDRDE